MTDDEDIKQVQKAIRVCREMGAHTKKTLMRRGEADQQVCFSNLLILSRSLTVCGSNRQSGDESAVDRCCFVNGRIEARYSYIYVFLTIWVLKKKTMNSSNPFSFYSSSRCRSGGGASEVRGE